MDCIICGNPIIGKRKDSKYCSTSCTNKAKQIRAARKLFNELGSVHPDNDMQEKNMVETSVGAVNELREVEKENFNTILNIRSEYETRIRELESINLKQTFKIDKLEDKIEELKEKHKQELEQASSNTTKETVASISQMPAIQSALGALACKILPGEKGSALNGVSNGLTIQEQQIVDSIRRMQPDAQNYLVQMLYVLFAKSHEEQMEIFTSLQAYMTQVANEEEP